MEEKKNQNNNSNKNYHHNHGGNKKNQNAANNESKENGNSHGNNNHHKGHRPNHNKRRNGQHNKHRHNNNNTSKELQSNDVAEVLESIENIVEDTAVEESKNEAVSAEAEMVETSCEIVASDEKESTKSEVMVEVVGVRFKSSEKTYYFEPAGFSLSKGMQVIVETARGLEFGEIYLANTSVSESDIVPPLRPVVRVATEADKKHNLENKEKEKDAFAICNEQIIAHKLDMKLIDAQYTFDNSKLLFYFTSSGRVDFRELVKDLAAVFKTRIELRQIGIRDEAKLIGGLGICGRPLCCSVFLTDFGQVSIKMAKEQNLSLNSTKISGICGRLMCCLRFEHETYEYEIKRTPPVDSTVKTKDGIGTVVEISPLAGTVKVRFEEKPDTAPKSYHRDEVTVIKK